MTSILQKLWSGQHSLPLAFLGFFVFGFWVVLFLAAIVSLIAMQLQLDRLGFILAFVIMVSYWLIASVGVWRSAGVSMVSDNSVSKVEAMAARGFVLLVAAYAFWSLYNGGALWLMQRVSA